MQPPGLLRGSKAYLEDLLANMALEHVVGFDIDHTSSRLDLSTLLEVAALPLRSYKIG